MTLRNLRERIDPIDPAGAAAAGRAGKTREEKKKKLTRANKLHEVVKPMLLLFRFEMYPNVMAHSEHSGASRRQ